MEDPDRLRLQNKFTAHPKTKSNFLSNFFFCWETSMILRGWKKEFTEEDLYAPLQEYDSKNLGDKLGRLWSVEENFQKNPSLTRALTKLFGFEVLTYGLIFFPVTAALALLQPWFLKRLLNYYSSDLTRIKQKEVFICASVLTATFLLQNILMTWFMFQQQILGMKARVACSSLIYRKTLKLKKCHFQKVGTGQVVNLLSNDVNGFDLFFTFVYSLWISPLFIVAGSYFIDAAIGHAALSGVSVIFACLVLQFHMAKKFGKLRRRIAQKTDYRLRLLDDIISGIQVIKMYTWETLFSKLMKTARKLELRDVTLANQLRLLNFSLKAHVSKVAVFVSTLVAVLTGLSLTAEYVFTLVCLYEAIKTFVIFYLPLALVAVAETRICVLRIQEFLLCDHANQSIVKSVKTPKTLNIRVLKTPKILSDGPAGVAMDNVSFKWNQSLASNLSNVSFRAELGELVAVLGAAGSGKSTLLQIILKEVDGIKGHLDVRGNVSLAAQDSWIFSGSIKQNIVFAEAFDLERYQKVVTICALDHDLALLPFGDQTLVGERGVMLSGGQKARVNLARAIYRDADIYLLDDPLSAVDAHVAKQIFEKCILEFLKEKCVVLVTHQFQYLRNVDRIYVIADGVVDCQDFDKIVEFQDRFIHKNEKVETGTIFLKHKLASEEREHRSVGTKEKKNYNDFCVASGSWMSTYLTFFLFVIAQVALSFVDYSIMFWVNLEQTHKNSNSTLNSFFTSNNCLYIYSSLVVLMVLTNHAASFNFSLYCTRALKTLYRNMFGKILHGTLTFFNHHSSGRILNRFSRDVGTIDEVLPKTMFIAMTSLLTILGTMVIIIILNYWMIIPTVVLLAAVFTYTVIFQPTNRNLKRTEGITRSFIYTHMAASIQGLATIRASDAQNILIQEFDNHLNTHTSVFYNFLATFAAFTFWTNITCGLYSGVVTFSFLLLGFAKGAGSVGLGITQSISLKAIIEDAMKNIGDLNANMTSVERVVEYSELNPEVDERKNTPPESWPCQGRIIFRSVTMQYTQHKQTVLKNVSFEIKPGEKIGIVGRTGAGKTSLISTLFRLFPFEGKIVIDGVDTKSIPLNALRSKISIIPQDPVLFLGTLRKNLDPFDNASDNQLWNALEEVGLKATISNLPSGLETLVSEKGSNFSVGERQLLCLARIMLRKTKIVVLDEATANVDLNTDEMIQTTIRKKFQDCTVLTIAHRLHTVLDSDKILIMDDGNVAEFGHPLQLLQDPNGVFYGYVKKNGHTMISTLNKNAEFQNEEGEA